MRVIFRGNQPDRARDAQPGAAPDTVAGEEADSTAKPQDHRIDWDMLRTAERSCCCPARPAVVVIMPPSPGRPHRTDLLLCMHHFRISQDALAAANAVAFDRDGRLVTNAPVHFLAA